MYVDSLPSFLNDVDVLAIVCYQWGDTGKGKVIDFFSDWADVFARGTGGPNAGHTLTVNGKKIITHQIPSGILRDKERKTNIMGSGMVIDLESSLKEMSELREAGCTFNGLRISDRAQLILPYHKVRDRLQSSMGSGEIGTTGRGIGPAYADKIMRLGPTVGDLKDKSRFVKMLEKVQQQYPGTIFNIEEVIEQQSRLYEEIKDLVCDTDKILQESLKEGARVLLEGAQGLLLSVDYGTYPYCTSSDPSIYGLTRGVGLTPDQVDLTLGIVKFPFMTRVGNGPFPTEFGGMKSESYCAEGNGNAHKQSIENAEFGSRADEMLRSDDEFERGRALRLIADEYGATTRRPRRIGRTDLVALKYAIGVNGPNLVLTKPDCTSELEEIELGVGYRTTSGETITEITHGRDITYGLEGVYERLPWNIGDISRCERVEDLPENMKSAMGYVASRCKTNIKMVSVGPEAKQTIIN